MGRFFVIAGIVVVALVLAPVGFLAMRSESHPPELTVLYNSYGAKVRSIDPATCGDTTSAAMQGSLYEGLYAYHYLKRPPELIPQLATDMPEITNDGQTYTIRIKPKIHYSRNECFGRDADGQPKTRAVKAQDFVLGIKRIADFHIQTQLSWSLLSGRIVGLDAFRERCEKDFKEGDFSRYHLDVEGIQAVDEHTLRIKLVEPYPQLVWVLAINNYAPIPRELIDYHLATEPDGEGGRRPIPMERRSATIDHIEQIVGTGAYLLTCWERGSRMAYERNPEHQHSFYPSEGEPSDAEAGLLADAGAPLPFIDVLDFKCVQEDMPAWLQFLSMQTDVSGIPRDVFASVITPDRDLVDRWKKKGIRLVTFDYPAVYWLAFNVEDPVFKASKSLRQAMCLAFNVEDYIELMYNGRGVRAINTLPRSFPTHEMAGAGSYYRYDPAQAKVKLKAAKRELAAAGLLEADGQIPEITVDYPGQDEMFRRMGEYTKQQFVDLGLRIRVVLNDWPTLQKKVHNKQTQMYAMGWHADQPDAENFLQLYYSPNILKGTNNTNYSNPEFDRLYERIRVMTDSPQRRELYVQMVHMLNEDVPVLLLSEPDVFVLMYEWIKNYKRHPYAYGLTKYRRIDTALRRKMGGR